jgi:uncharacterized protein (TIGR02246 family)
MSSPTHGPRESQSSVESEICALYQQMLEGWNNVSGEAMAATFLDDGTIIGFDGSQHGYGSFRTAL